MNPLEIGPKVQRKRNKKLMHIGTKMKMTKVWNPRKNSSISPENARELPGTPRTHQKSSNLTEIWLKSHSNLKNFFFQNHLSNPRFFGLYRRKSSRIQPRSRWSWIGEALRWSTVTEDCRRLVQSKGRKKKWRKKEEMAKRKKEELCGRWSWGR